MFMQLTQCVNLFETSQCAALAVGMATFSGCSGLKTAHHVERHDAQDLPGTVRLIAPGRYTIKVKLNLLMLFLLMLVVATTLIRMHEQVLKAIASNLPTPSGRGFYM